MKRLTILAGAALFAAVAAGAADAQDREPRPMRDADVTRAQIVERVDQRFARLDVDNDGRFTPEDARARGEQRRAQRAGRLFERLDSDRNGAISRAEFDRAREARGGERRGPGLRGHRGGRAMAMRRMRGAAGGMRGMRLFGEEGFVTREQLRERALARFDRADADRNGVLTVAERREARGHRVHRRGGGGRPPRDDE